MVFTWRNLFLFIVITSIDVFVYLFSLCVYSCTASAFPKTAEHATMCSLLRTARPFFLTRNASFEICNLRRSWHVMTLSKTRRGPGCLSPFVVRSEDPGEAMAVLNAWQKINFGSAWYPDGCYKSLVFPQVWARGPCNTLVLSNTQIVVTSY